MKSKEFISSCVWKTNDSRIYQTLSTKAPRFPGPEQYRHHLNGIAPEYPPQCPLLFAADIADRLLSRPPQGWSGKRIHTKRTEFRGCGSTAGGAARHLCSPHRFLRRDVSGSWLRGHDYPRAKRKFSHHVVRCCPRHRSEC